MTNRKRRLLGVTLAAVCGLSVFAAVGCRPTTHAVTRAEIGRVASSRELEAALGEPGPILAETVISADWVVSRAGLINLDHEKARAAKLEDDNEPIHIYFHALRHPSQGLFIIDTGVEKALRDDPERAAIRGLVAMVMHTEKMLVHHDLGGWLEAQQQPLAGVLLTHLHLDHVLGMPDVPRGTPIFLGPQDTATRSLENAFVQPVLDRALEGQAPLSEWAFGADGILDVFGDASVFAIWVPGHTPGSTAYLARTPTGPVLFTGDACHSAWGWNNGVEPGTFSENKPESAVSLARLIDLVRRHPEIDVRLGHQALDRPIAAEKTTARE